MPVNAPQTLISEEGAGAAGKFGVAEGGFKYVLHRAALRIHQRRKFGLAFEGLQRCADVLKVAQAAAKVIQAVMILGEEAGVLSFDQSGRQLQMAELFGQQRILFEESGQNPIGIEDVGVLVRAVKRAAAQAFQKRQGFLAVQQARREDRNLPFQHLIQAVHVGAARLEAQQIIRMIERICAPVGAQAVFHVVLRGGQKGVYFARRHLAQLSAQAVIVDVQPVAAARLAQRVHHPTALLRGEFAAQGGAEGLKNLGDGLEQIRHFTVQGKFALFFCHQAAEKGQETPQVAQSDHRKAIPHQGIVGIVPLRPLGVHPNPAFGDEVDQLGQSQREQLFGERSMHHAAVRGGQQTRVTAVLADLFFDALMQGVIKYDRVVNIFL